jgi:hypothetical protein
VNFSLRTSKFPPHVAEDCHKLITKLSFHSSNFAHFLSPLSASPPQSWTNLFCSQNLFGFEK